MRRRWATLLLAAACLATACVPGVTRDSPEPSTEPGSSYVPSTPTPLSSSALTTLDMTAALLAKSIPYADGFALTRAVRGRDGVPAKGFEPVRTTPPAEDVGSTHDFWTYDFAAKRNVKTKATLRLMTDHAKWWTANDTSVDLTSLRQTANTFESKTYPTDRGFFGSEWSPGIDGDPRINLVFARLPGSAAGYFSGADEVFRGIYTRAGIGFAREALAITSAIAGEGKTTVGVGLGVAVAQDFPELRVLLVETDIQRPALAADLAAPGTAAR